MRAAGVGLIMIACGGGAADPTAPDASVPDAGVGTVVGTYHRRAWGPSGESWIPFDLGDWEIAAIPHGGEPIPGTGFADGRFEIPDVPHGWYWLRVGDFYLDTAARSHALWIPGSEYDLAPTAEETIAIELHVDNLYPWSDGDDLLFGIVGAGGFIPITWFSDAWPAAGATALSGERIEWWAGWPLLDAARGDRLFLQQRPRVTADRLTYSATRRYFDAPITIAPGTTPVVAGAFDDVPNDREIRMRVRSDLFGVPSNGRTYLEVVASPTDDRLGPRAWPAHAFVDGGEPVDIAFRHGDPFPDDWVRYVTISFSSGIDQILTYSVDEILDREVVPVLGPIRELTIDGVPVGDAPVRGETPTLRWEPPDPGTVDLYFIAILEAGALGRRLFTPRTEVTLPPGVLGTGYKSLWIQSHSGSDPSNPHDTRLPAASTHVEYSIDVRPNSP